MTLDWLLIFGAIAGLAAGSVLVVQIVVDDSSDLPDRPDVRIVDAEIAAAIVASEATEEEQANAAYTDLEFATRCQEITSEFKDVMDPAIVWVPPDSATDPPIQAKCNLKRLP